MPGSIPSNSQDLQLVVNNVNIPTILSNVVVLCDDSRIKTLKEINYNSPENLSHPSSVRPHLPRFKNAKATRAAYRINTFYN